MDTAKPFPDDIFRGYDIRGLVDTELTVDLYERFGRAYAVYLSRLRIRDAVVGADCRYSSPGYKEAFIKGLLESGINVYDIGMTLTQIFYFAQYHFLAKGGAMITASHNPKEYNGLKIARGYSETMETEEIMEFKEIVKSGVTITGKEKGTYIEEDVFPYYKKDILKLFPEKFNFRIVIDTSKGTGGKFFPEIMREAGCEVVESNTDIDPYFSLGAPDPTDERIQRRLAGLVLEHKTDLGFSYDGDGDRMGIVDEKGGLIWNDVLVSIFAKDLLEYIPKTKIIYNVLCSKQATDVILESGGIPIMWKVGHSFIKAKVKEERAYFGGELSGHFFFMDNFYGHDDSVIASLRILDYLRRKQQTLSEVVGSLPHYFSSPEIKVDCADAVKFNVVDNEIARAVVALYPDAKKITIEGIRVETDDSMIVVRASQNGPYITVKFEARTKEGYDIVRKQVIEVLKGCPEVDVTKGDNIPALLEGLQDT